MRRIYSFSLPSMRSTNTAQLESVLPQRQQRAMDIKRVHFDPKFEAEDEDRARRRRTRQKENKERLKMAQQHEHEENSRIVGLITQPDKHEIAQYWYDGNFIFRCLLDGLFLHLRIAGADLAGQLLVLRGLDLDALRQDATFNQLVFLLRTLLVAGGGLTMCGFVTPDTTPEKSPSRGGRRDRGDDNGNGAGDEGEGVAAA